MARVEAAGLASARDAINEARAMKVSAMSALIIAGGAMLAAMASAFIAFLALTGDDNYREVIMQLHPWPH